MTVRRLLIGVWFVGLLALAVSAAVADPVTARITLTDAGLQTNGGSWWPTLSADGRFMAYHSWADNITAGDTNWVYDVYVLDRLFGVSHLISVSQDGVVGDKESLYPAISADGRAVAFCSEADNLVPGDANGLRDIFVRNWTTGVTELISVSTSGEQADAPCDRPWISGDGRYVVFQSEADNLVSGVGGERAVFLRDRVAHTTTCVSVSSAGVPASFPSFEPTITPDGRYVVFSSWDNGLAPGDANTTRDVFLRDLQLGLTERVSVSTSGAAGNDPSGGPRCGITPDGRFVAFTAIAGNLVAGDTNGVSDVFVRDRLLGTTERVSVSSSGAQGDRPSGEGGYIVAISADGRYVAFSSLADNLVPGDTNGAWDVFVHDRETGITTRASVSQAGFGGNGDSGYYGLALESHGAFVVFDSLASNLVDGDTDNAMDVYLHGDPTLTAAPLVVINGDALETNSTSVMLSSYAGTYPELRYRDEGGSWTAWAPSTATRAWTLPPGDGVKRVYVQGRDGVDISGVAWDEIMLDTTPPGGVSVSINSGAAETPDRSVTLTLTATGAARMRLRNEGEAWSWWRQFSITAEWTLSAGPGVKRVSVETRDEAGNLSAEVYDEILLNPTPPTGLGVLINGDDDATNNPAVTLQFSTLDAVEMRVRDDGGAWTSWEPFAATKPWVLPGGDGVKRVYAQGRSADLAESPETWDEIVLDTAPPSDVLLSINNDAGFTNTTSVTLTLTATDAAEMRFHNQPEAWSAWEPAALHKEWMLPVGDGLKRVYVQVRDEVGNESPEVYADIILNTQPPTGLAISINGGAATTISHHVTLTLSATGAAGMRFHNETDVWSDWRPFAATTPWMLSGPRGAKTVTFQARDAAGNLSGEVSGGLALVNFPDVPEGYWAYSQIMSCVDAGVVGGYADGYRPEETVNRAQMAVYISRALVGGDANVPPGPAIPSFPDVPAGYWAYRYIEYAKTASIVHGYRDGYHPEETVNRAQMAVYVARAIVNPTGDAGLAGYTPPSTPTFPDVPTDFWAYKYIEYCKAQGVVGGYGDGYRPGEPVTRAQMAVYVARAFQLP